MRNTDLQGAVGEASTGSKGIIYKIKTRQKGPDVYVGVSFSGVAWGSRRPKILAHSLNEYIGEQIEKEISNEKKSYLDAARRAIKNIPKDTHPDDVLQMLIDTINDRALDRREKRGYAPKAPPPPSGDSLSGDYVSKNPDDSALIKLAETDEE